MYNKLLQSCDGDLVKANEANPVVLPHGVTSVLTKYLNMLGDKSRRQTVIQHGRIKGRIRDNKGQLVDNKVRLAAGLGPWSLGLNSGLRGRARPLTVPYCPLVVLLVFHLSLIVAYGIIPK